MIIAGCRTRGVVWRERTEPEFRALLARAGLEVSPLIPTRTSVSIIEAFSS